MHKELRKTPLRQAVELLAGVVDRRASIPILMNVRIAIGDGRMTLVATDLDLEVSVVAQEGGFSDADALLTTAPCHVLRNILAVTNIESIGPMSGAFLTVAAEGDAVYSLSTLPAQDFPLINEFKVTHSFRLASADLLADLMAVRAGISTEETRYYLNGVYLHVQEGTLRFATTDGHRLFRVIRPLPEGAANMPGTIVPRGAVKTLIAALESIDGNDDVQVEIGDLKVRFTLPGVTILTKAIDGAFPDYGRVIPTSTSGTLKAKASDLIAAAEACGALMNERTRPVQFHFSADDSFIRAKSSESGLVCVSMPGTVSGPMPPTLGLNAAYLIDCCTPFGDGEVNVNVSESSAPVLFTCDKGPAKRLTVVQMPMRV